MATFEEIQQQLAAAQAQREALQRQRFIAGEQVKKSQARLDALQRQANPDNPEALEQQKLLNARLKKNAATAKHTEAELTQLGGVLDGHWAKFLDFTDPRQHIGFFNDRTPVLLLPLRLETRFKKLGGFAGAAGVINQLWVRVYPDDCSIDTFEPVLSDTETANVRRFWAAYWSAGGDIAREREAWRGLVGAHGAGRAGYLVQQYRPLNEAQAPEKIQPDDVILTIADNTALTGSQKNALETYWKAIWLADGNLALGDQAWQTFVAAAGSEDAALKLRLDFRPQNLAERPVDKAKNQVALGLLFVDFPTEDDFPTQRFTWSKPAQTRLLPERFVLLAYRNGELIHNVLGNLIPDDLQVGPDPSSEEQLKKDKENGSIEWGDGLRWMSDFDDAVTKGMGFKINLSQQDAAEGFDRVMVLGVRLRADADTARIQLEALLAQHQQSKSGLAILPQGVATNNTETNDSFYKRTDDSDDSFEVFLKNKNQFEPETDARLKKDGQWLAEWLGLQVQTFQKTPNAGQTDQCEARAMNTALWHATLGHFIDTELQPVFSDQDEEFVRQYFTRYVSGRGPVPALRIGRQPYGILPVTAFNRLHWMNNQFDHLTHVSQNNNRLQKLYELLLKLEQSWRFLLFNVSWVGKPGLPGGGDAHQMLLDILGLHPTSEAYHYRYAHSLEYLYNHYQLSALGRRFLKDLNLESRLANAKSLLQSLGYNGDETPDILEKFFFSGQRPLGRFLIDDRPLSETDLIRTYTTDPTKTDDPLARNYLRWLRETAAASMEDLRLQKGFFENKPPQTLLYVLLRFALLQGYHSTGLRTLVASELLATTDMRRMRKEARFVNIAEKGQSDESRWDVLNRPVNLQPDKPNQTLHEYIARELPNLSFALSLKEQLDALQHLENVPTARLERLLAEHVDTCSYRFDAWRMGLLHLQLDLMRRQQTDKEPGGIYLGAYGWVEHLRPENKTFQPVHLDNELAEFFLKNDPNPPLFDATNGGHVLAPSLNHAVTAAVLRNGFMANAVPGQPEVLAVDLSSERVRQALAILEGMRNGQKLGALLGYRLERILHDRTDGLELDRFILPLRQAFPLAARRIKKTAGTEDTPVEALEARNVPDGLELVRHVTQTRLFAYPYGKANKLPASTTPAERAALDAAVQQIVALRDAVADLAIAESVHQAVMGNHERTAANLDGYAGASVPTEPEVVRTPRSGTVLTHRIGVHFDPAATLPPGSNARATAEPGLQRWLEKVLPEPADIACSVAYRPRNANADTTLTVTAAQINLQAIDLLYLYAADRQQSMTAIDDRLVVFVAANFDVHPGSEIKILYTAPIAGKVTLFALNPLLESLSNLILSARPLEATDVLPPAQTTTDHKSEPMLDAARVTAARAIVQSFLNTQVKPLADELQSRFDPPPVQEVLLAQNIDSYLAQFRNLALPAGNLGLLNAGFVAAWDVRQQIFTALIQKIEDYAKRWDAKIVEFDGLIADYLVAAPADKQDLLLRAERTLSTQSTDPATIADLEIFRTHLETVTRLAFTTRLTQLRALVTNNGQALSALLAAAESLDNTAFDATALDFAESKQSIVQLADTLRGRAVALRDALQKRLDAADGYLAGLPTAADARARVNLLLEAGKALLGDDFRLFPAFALRNDHANEWANAFNDTARLLDFAGKQTPFPVDDWLYGVARVREKMRHYENILLLSGAFKRTAPELKPAQFPFTAQPETYDWLATAYSANMKIASEPLLYTAHYVDDNFFNTAAPQCGALVDEWTEVIPVKKETAGLAFHYDRPNNEAPQAWLLATPAQFSGHWQWADLVDALHDTLQVAQLRAVEPDHLDKTSYAPFLPAIISAAAAKEVSILGNFALTQVKQVLPFDKIK